MLKAFGFHSVTPMCKLLERLFKEEELIFKEVGCDDACSLGKELEVPVFKFVKEALISRFG